MQTTLRQDRDRLEQDISSTYETRISTLQKEHERQLTESQQELMTSRSQSQQLRQQVVLVQQVK